MQLNDTFDFGNGLAKLEAEKKEHGWEIEAHLSMTNGMMTHDMVRALDGAMTKMENACAAMDSLDQPASEDE